MEKRHELLNLTELTHLPALQDMLIEYCKAHQLTSLSMEKILCVLFCTMAIRNEKNHRRNAKARKL
jgi:hypothetical protein